MPGMRWGGNRFFSKAGRVAAGFAAAALAGCIHVHPFEVPADVQAVSVEIDGYGKKEDKFRLYIDEPAKVGRVAEAVNGIGGRRQFIRFLDVQDGSSANIVFYRGGQPAYTIYAYHDSATDGGSYYEVGTDLVSRQWWARFE